LLNKEKVDEFVAMVKCAKQIYGEGEIKDTTNRKRKRSEEDTDSDVLQKIET
jgi:hypothetical protein